MCVWYTSCMTCRGCSLAKNKDTRCYFYKSRHDYCKGCYAYVYIGRGYLGRRVGVKTLKVQYHDFAPGYKIKVRVIKKYAHSADVTGRDHTRELVRKRDNYTCQSCHKRWRLNERRFDVHHLKGLCGKLSKNYDKVETMPRLITLCHKCHFNHHQHSQVISGKYSQ